MFHAERAWGQRAGTKAVRVQRGKWPSGYRAGSVKESMSVEMGFELRLDFAKWEKGGKAC